MGEVSGLLAIWYREFIVFTREKSRVIASIVNPLLFLVIFGAGLGSSVSVQDMSYQSFIFPGIIAMTLIFTSIFWIAQPLMDLIDSGFTSLSTSVSGILPSNTWYNDLITKGIIIIVRKRSRRLEIVLAAIIAGIAHAYPESMGINDLPLSPNFDSGLSTSIAALAR